MESRGLVEQTGPAREYRLGPAVLRLAALRETAVPTRDAAMPVLRRLAEATERPHLSHLVAGRLQTLAFAYSARHGMKVTMEDADFLPFHATASGRRRPRLPAGGRGRPPPLRHPRPRGRPRKDRPLRRHGWAETVSTFEKDVHGTAVPSSTRPAPASARWPWAAAAPRMTPALHATITAELAQAGPRSRRCAAGSFPNRSPASGRPPPERTRP